MTTTTTNRSKLDTWLEERRARLLWKQPVRNVGHACAYQVGDAVAIVMTYSAPSHPEMGWDLFVPASLDTRIDATLAAADRALAVKGICKDCRLRRAGTGGYCSQCSGREETA